MDAELGYRKIIGCDPQFDPSNRFYIDYFTIFAMLSMFSPNSISCSQRGYFWVLENFSIRASSNGPLAGFEGSFYKGKGKTSICLLNRF